jgi:hypothetical protein
MTDPQPQCLVCQATSQEIPLLALQFRQGQYFICPSHLPILIHQPHKLVGILPGAEHLSPQEHDHDH